MRPKNAGYQYSHKQKSPEYEPVRKPKHKAPMWGREDGNMKLQCQNKCAKWMEQFPNARGRFMQGMIPWTHCPWCPGRIVDVNKQEEILNRLEQSIEKHKSYIGRALNSFAMAEGLMKDFDITLKE